MDDNPCSSESDRIPRAPGPALHQFLINRAERIQRQKNDQQSQDARTKASTNSATSRFPLSNVDQNALAGYLLYSAVKGVEGVETDCKSHKVVVKGEKADPIKVLKRVQRKSHRQVELLSPIPKPPEPAAEEPKAAEVKKVSKPEERKAEPQVITVVLKVHMHCEACAQEIKKRIMRMKGVENAEPDLINSQVTVKGVFEAPKLV
ncbi:hypothetical protein ACET3Z_001396 [Daucus carota]